MHIELCRYSELLSTVLIDLHNIVSIVKIL